MDSAAGVAEQLGALEGDIGRVREQIWHVQYEMDVFGAAELSAVEKLADASQERLFMVCAVMKQLTGDSKYVGCDSGGPYSSSRTLARGTESRNGNPSEKS